MITSTMLWPRNTSLLLFCAPEALLLPSGEFYDIDIIYLRSISHQNLSSHAHLKIDACQTVDTRLSFPLLPKKERKRLGSRLYACRKKKVNI